MPKRRLSHCLGMRSTPYWSFVLIVAEGTACYEVHMSAVNLRLIRIVAYFVQPFSSYWLGLSGDLYATIVHEDAIQDIIT